MLVKFLSFIASVLSNARYKAVLVPSTVVVLAVTGLTAIAIMHDRGSNSAASTTAKAAEISARQPAKTPQVSGQQNPKDTRAAIDGTPVEGSSNGQGSAAGSSQSATGPSGGSLELSVSKTNLTMSPGTTSSPIIAATLDNSTVIWSITHDNDETSPVSIVSEKAKEASEAAAYTFRFYVAPNATPGQYQFILSAKDAARGGSGSGSTSKVITIIVNS